MSVDNKTYVVGIQIRMVSIFIKHFNTEMSSELSIENMERNFHLTQHLKVLFSHSITETIFNLPSIFYKKEKVKLCGKYIVL